MVSDIAVPPADIVSVPVPITAEALAKSVDWSFWTVARSTTSIE